MLLSFALIAADFVQWQALGFFFSFVLRFFERSMGFMHSIGRVTCVLVVGHHGEVARSRAIDGAFEVLQRSWF
jgi:hypothetical protein